MFKILLKTRRWICYGLEIQEQIVSEEIMVIIVFGNMPYQVQNAVSDELVWDSELEDMCYNVYAGVYNLLRN